MVLKSGGAAASSATLESGGAEVGFITQAVASPHLNGAPLGRLRSRKEQSLLALLTLRYGREVERAWLAGML